MDKLNVERQSHVIPRIPKRIGRQSKHVLSPRVYFQVWLLNVSLVIAIYCPIIKFGNWKGANKKQNEIIKTSRVDVGANVLSLYYYVEIIVGEIENSRSWKECVFITLNFKEKQSTDEIKKTSIGIRSRLATNVLRLLYLRQPLTWLW